MMNYKVENLKDKEVLLLSYTNINKVDDAIKHICDLGSSGIQISILGKLDDLTLEYKFSNYWSELKEHCADDLKLTSSFGLVSNAEIGTFFIAGFLAPMFLQEINGKTIGSMSTGLYGILRGLGLNKESVLEYSNALHKGNYILIIRAHKSELLDIEGHLKESL